ncbi:MAG: DNA recombination protein RmuC [Parachlamydiales bacterium]|nr:DNA recombination protein RmuC [Parachlamydiales bacterium]
MNNLIILFAIFFVLAIIFIYFFVKANMSKTQKELSQTFKSLSFDIMQKNTQMFVNIAEKSFDKYHVGFKGDLEVKQKELENLINPVKESLEKIDKYSQDIELKRQAAYSSLKSQIDTLIESENILRKETHNLANALRSPNVRGTWGQMHLKRVVELAGLLDNCDFYEEATIHSEDKQYRPDLIVRLPGKRHIIIDAKTPIDAFLDSQDKDKIVEIQKLQLHANQLKKHINDLSSKCYYAKIENTPEYVILFLPSEAFLSTAIKTEPTILEIAAKKNIIVATPTTLIAILKTIAHLWNQEKINENSKEIAKIGIELYERLNTMNGYFTKLGKNLSISIDAYNQAIASYNSRVMVSAKKLKDIGLSSKELAIDEISKACSNISINPKIEV